MEGTSLPVEERVLVLAPTGRDADLTVEVLRQNDVLATPCRTIEQLCDGIRRGAAAAIVTEEAMTSDAVESVAACVDGQPAWSDLPLVVFTTRGESYDRLLAMVGMRFDITCVERPVRVATLVSAVRTALRARRRQYEVRDLLARLQADDARKDQFLAMLGHELRNPLAAMDAAIELLDDPDAVAHARQVLSRQMRNLTTMVSDLLDLSRITRGKITLQDEPIDLADVVRRGVSWGTRMAEARHQRLSVRLPEDAVVVVGDACRLEQVFTNLLTNAIKYTPEEGNIEVSLGREQQQAVLRVRDDGIGIEPELHSAIFEPFTQADSSLHHSSGGLGLGLPVVRSLVTLHGGEVRVVSEGLGRGSELVVRLPLAEPNVVPRASAPPVDPDRASALRLLLVDDDDDLRAMMSSLLRRWKHEVHAAASAEEGLAVLHDSRPDIALVDIGLPGMNGYQLASEVCSRLGANRPVLIAMTGYGRAEDRRLAREAGFDEHLTKPVEARDLRAMLERFGGAVDVRGGAA